MLQVRGVVAIQLHIASRLQEEAKPYGRVLRAVQGRVGRGAPAGRQSGKNGN